MNIHSLSFSSEELDSLAERLAFLYIQNSGECCSSPKEFADFFVQTLEQISDELNEIRKNG